MPAPPLLAQRALTLAQQLLHIVSGYIVHDKVLATGRLDKIISDLGQVGMRQPGKDERLTLELLLGICGDIQVLLDRNQVIGQVGVFSQID